MKPAVKILGKVSISAEGAWDRNKEYERLCLVYREIDNHSFLSKKCVPKGTDLSNTEYWQKVGVVGYKNNDIVVINDIDSSTGEVVRHNLTSAINVISPIDRTPGLIVSFYGVADDSYNNLDWHLYQFKSNDVSEWQDLTNWENINYSAVKVEVTDTLTSTDPKAALSANMGRVLSNMISSIVGFSTSIVTTLPATGQSGVVYFVKNDSSTETRNVYTEYVWLDSIGVYEELGEFTTAVDLSSYQEKLVSGNNIKTVFGNSILGSGNITMPIASDTAYGGVKLGYSAIGDNVPVLKDVNGKLYVTIPRVELTRQTIIDLLGYTPANQLDINNINNAINNINSNFRSITISSLGGLSQLNNTIIAGAPGIYYDNSGESISINSDIITLGYSRSKSIGKIIVKHGTTVNFNIPNSYMQLDYESMKEIDAEGFDIYTIFYDAGNNNLFIDLIVYGVAVDRNIYGNWDKTVSPNIGSYDMPTYIESETTFTIDATRTNIINDVSETETVTSLNNISNEDPDAEFSYDITGEGSAFVTASVESGQLVITPNGDSTSYEKDLYVAVYHNKYEELHTQWWLRLTYERLNELED